MEYLETEISRKLYKIMELSEELNRDLTFKWDFPVYQRNRIEAHIVKPLNDIQETIFEIQNYINNK
jgi:hypothetical protein